MGRAQHLARPDVAGRAARGDARRRRASFRQVLLSSAAPHDSLQVTRSLSGSRCAHSLRLHASHMTSGGRPPAPGSPLCPLLRGRRPSALAGSGPGAAAAPRRLALRYRLPWNAAIPQAPGERRAPEEPAAAQVPCCSSKCTSAVLRGACSSRLDTKLS